MRDPANADERTRSNDERAVVARRAPPGEAPDTTEIEGLAEAAGYEVVGACTQSRREDPGTNLGAGKVEELAALVEEAGADLAILDNELTPGQTVELEERLPGVDVVDRYRLVLSVFADQADSHRAKLQVEHARLTYELPRIRERTGQHVLNRATEKGTRVNDVEDRIAGIERKLDAMPSPAERFRERRREEGFDLVAVAGYTNAGKSTLLHRLADDLDVADADPDHGDVDATASIEDRLFETLETTTRRATVGGRTTLLTDTVGFVDDLPHGLVESFSSTLGEVAAADAVVLVADAARPPDRLRATLATAREVIDGAGADPDSAVVALNKVDRLDDGELAERRDAVVDLAPDPVAVSALHGEGIDRLEARVRERLPTARAELVVPNCDGAMGLVSWAYDHCEVLDVEYDERVRIELAGRPALVERARSRAAAVGEPRTPADEGDAGSPGADADREER
jgi:GTP-binding protein HflX